MNVPTRKRLRQGRRRAFQLYHALRRGDIGFGDDIEAGRCDVMPVAAGSCQVWCRRSIGEYYC